MTAPPKVDLDSCASEPIHIPGSIQPHGALLVCDTDEALIAYASANAAQVLARDDGTILGRPLTDVLGLEVTHDLRNAVAKGGGSLPSGALLGQHLPGNPRTFDLLAHRHGGRFIVEIEQSHGIDGNTDAFLLTQTLVQRLARESKLQAIANAGVKLVRATLGYDRVMMYRFLHNDAGCVIAEARRADMNSFLGQHFPAADIPAQARRLYLENWIRVIGNAAYEPVPLVSAPGARADPVDMSHVHLRSVSPIHCEYLRNMGVAASMSMSIVVDGALWGLIACHHDSPKTLSLPLRSAAALFAQFFSLQVNAAERRAEVEAAREARLRVGQLFEQIRPDRELSDVLEDGMNALSALIPSDGAAMLVDGNWRSRGIAPERTLIESLLQSLDGELLARTWHTGELRKHLIAADGDRSVAGVLVVPVSATPRDYLFLFRKEESQTVTWAGPPMKQIVYAQNGPRLTPRGSFDAWREEVQGCSLPWRDSEVLIADVVRTYMRDAALRQSEVLQNEHARIERQRRMLNDELNHRVKNILALVKSLAMQTGNHATSITAYTTSLEGRLRALSYAHGQSLSFDDHGDLAALIDAEAGLHRYHDGERVTTDGPRIALRKSAFTAFALVIHEMMTNAVKYGALSTSEGRLAIRWSLSEGDLHILWSERGGPAVSKPQRTGFGSTLIQSVFAYDLGGTSVLDFSPQGLTARFVIPGRHVGVMSAPLPGAPDIPSLSPLLDGLSVLIAEDSSLIALDTESIARELGAAHVSAHPSTSTALAALSTQTFDIAILDFNLGTETSTAIADALHARGIPFIFVTGYSDATSIPQRFAATPVIRKPVDAIAMYQVLARVLLK